MDVEHTLEVAVGRAQPSTIGLSPGETVGPLSIGRMGGWRVAANGVAAEHGYLYFDGRDLWLQSLDPGAPLFVDGSPLPVTWTAVRSPCEIVLGAAKIRFAETEVEIERTADRFPAPRHAGPAVPPSPPSQPAPPPSQRMRPQNPFAPGELARPPDEDDSTRMGPLDVMAARARGAALSSARPVTPSAHPAGDIEQPTVVAGGGVHPPLAVPQQVAPMVPPPSPSGARRALLEDKPTLVQELPSAGGPGGGGLAGAWKNSSFPQKVTVFLLPLALGSVYVIFTDPQATELEEPSLAASASAAPSSSAADAPSAAPASSIVDAAPPSASAPVDRGSVEATPAVTAPPPPPVTARRGSTPQRTLERRAADSVAAGDWEGAAELYEQLAKDHPDAKAFAEAARILRAKK